MRIQLIAAGTRMPDWINAGYREYARRLPHECRLELKELALAKRSKNQSAEAGMEDEGQRMRKAIATDTAVIAMDHAGRAWSTEELARRLAEWLADGRDRTLLIGGPDGLSDEVRNCAEQAWSLSPLTLPHGLARVLTAEALYRAWSLLNGHPYHRGRS